MREERVIYSISTQDPEGGIHTHGHHLFSDAAKDTPAYPTAAAPHDNGPKIVNQGLSDNLPAWIHAFLRFEPMYALRWESAVDKHLARC